MLEKDNNNFRAVKFSGHTKSRALRLKLALFINKERLNLDQENGFMETNQLTKK